MKPNNNAKCPCGSGLRYQKCCLGKKERIYSTVMDFGEPVSAASVSIENNGQLIFYDEQGNQLTPVQSWCDVFYKRDRKEKIVYRIPFDNNQSLFHLKAIASFSKLLIVDTNTIFHDNNQISVTSAILAEVQHVQINPISVDFKITHLESLEFTNCKLSPEIFGSINFIHHIINTYPLVTNELLGIVVDFNLSDLHDYNKRKKYLYNNYFLPQQCQLIYASADTGMEFIQNKLIKIVDSASTEIIKLIKSGQCDKQYSVSTVEHVDRFRIWPNTHTFKSMKTNLSL